MQLQKGDVILCQSYNWFGYVILSVMRFFQSDPVNFSHVALATGPTTIIQSRFTIGETEFHPDTLKRYKILRYTSLSEDNADKMIKMARVLVGYPYGVKRLVAHLLDEIFQTHNFTHSIQKSTDQVCSSFVAWVYQKTLTTSINGLDWTEVDPDDFEDESLKNPNSWMIIDEKK